LSAKSLRNIAIIAHVDHGKTTLVDKLLSQSGTLDTRKPGVERVMDSNALERERGITILAKNTAIDWQDYRINIVDTPGHADFGGEVERILSMVDSALLLVDAQDGPMPQTRFVTKKAFSHRLKPIVVINKIDKPGARPDWVMDQVFDLFDKLGASDEQLDFQCVFASALRGYASFNSEARSGNMDPLFQVIIDHCPPPGVVAEGPLQMQVTTIDYNPYVGALSIGRIKRGSVAPNQQVAVIGRDGTSERAKISKVYGYLGLDKYEVEQARAGEIVALAGIERPRVSDTVCATDAPEALPPVLVDEPTVSMTFQVNTSPFAGREGRFLTSRQIKERLERECIHNVALRVDAGASSEQFMVSGRGELHLSILIETMRREGYELAVSRPRVINLEVDGQACEPYEQVAVDIEETHQGAVMEALGARGGDLKNMLPDGQGRVRLDYDMPSRGLIGFHTEFLTLTSGSGLLYHVFDRYAPSKKATMSGRQNGVMISGFTGKALAYALYNLQPRGRMLIGHGAEVYEGMVIGMHNRENDLTVNPLKGKQLTNFRAAGSDENIVLTPPVRFSLEQALAFIEDDELVEVTPKNIRVRKAHLTENERKRAARKAEGQAAA